MLKFVNLTLGAAIALGAPLAHSVALDPRGLGQVLIYPYYTVNGGNSTLLSVVNTTGHGKALKIRFREGYDGRYVLDFNIYLSPFDSWVGQIFDTSIDGVSLAAIATNDNSCTVPQLTNEHNSTPGQGPRSQPFRSGDYSDANSDGGPQGPVRLREGYIEVLEMGEITGATTLAAITEDASGVPAGCDQLISAWTNGYWTANPNTDLAPPSGGLYGAESIINVAQGTIFAVNAQAIDGFSATVQHTLPGNEEAPDLNTASKNAQGLVSAFVPIGSGMVRADFEKPEDAISALLMADSLLNEYVVAPGVGATTQWVVTFPTKRFYTDPELLGAAAPARAPFDQTFGPSGSCAPVGPVVFDREHRSAAKTGFELCNVANVLPIGTLDSAAGSPLRTSAPIDTSSAGFTSGHLHLWFDRDGNGTPVARHALTSANGYTFVGLPATGFVDTNYINANVVAGVLANYSGAYPFHASVNCTKTADTQGTCP